MGLFRRSPLARARRAVRKDDAPEKRAEAMAAYQQRIAKDPDYTEDMDFTKAQSALDSVKGDYQKERQEFDHALQEAERAIARLEREKKDLAGDLERSQAQFEAANLRASRAESDKLAAQESKRTELEALSSQMAILAGSEKSARQEAERLNNLIANATETRRKRFRR